MNKEHTIEQLQQLGLSAEQAKVYQTLIKHGFTKAGNIPKYTKIKRGLVYKVLDQLIELGLAEKHGEHSSVARYAPLSPQTLEMFVEEKRTEARNLEDVFDSVHGNLKSQFNLLSGKPSVQYFEGNNEVSKMLDDSLYTGDIIYTYADVDAVEKYFPDLNINHIKKRTERNIQKRILVADNSLGRKAQKKSLKDPLTEIRIMNKEYESFGCVAEIYDNKIAYITTSELGISGVLVEDKQVSKMQKFMFEALWELSK
jgi:sugar-specific transcriptional regulator TrmB